MRSTGRMGPGDLIGVLHAKGVSPRVVAAMAAVPRDELVPRNVRRSAWEDHPLPIGFGQTISQPSLVGLMTDALDIGSGSRVLDVGTGSGYQAAVFAALGADVHSVERIRQLADRSRETLARLGWPVPVKCGDGSKGWPEFAPFDAIVVAAATDTIPRDLLEQLAEPTADRRGGRLILPLSRTGSRAGQTLVLVERTSTGLRQSDLLGVSFVPLVIDDR